MVRSEKSSCSSPGRWVEAGTRIVWCDRQMCNDCMDRHEASVYGSGQDVIGPIGR